MSTAASAAESSESRAHARSAFMQADLLESIPHAKTHHTFLNANAQAHHSPLWAFADIIDNSREAWATQYSINMREGAMLEIVDNGEGMSEYTLSCAVSIAYTKKDFTTGKHYGMGVTTAVPRLATNALCFSYHPESRHYTCAYLSTALSKAIGSDELKLPQCTWSQLMPGAIMEHKVNRLAPFTLQQRHSSLSVILDNSPFKDEIELLAEFADLEERGTKWLLFDLRTEELKLLPDIQDVEMRGKAAASGSWPHEFSLRGFLEVLYYYDDEVAKREQMKLIIQGMPVIPRNWHTWLHHRGSASYRPQGGLPSSTAKMFFGYAQPLEKLIAAFEDRKAHKNQIGSSFERLSQYMGIFYYHQGDDQRMPARLTMPLEKTALQCKPLGALQNTHVRLAKMGKALVGCCRENYLVQAHNKSEYVIADSLAAQHSIVALKAKCNEKMAEFLKTRIVPALQTKVKSVPYGYRNNKAAHKPWEDGQSEDELQDVDDDDDAHSLASLEADASRAGEGSSSHEIEEGGRYEVIADPSVVGFAVWASKSHDLVRLRTSTGSGRGRVSKATYRPHELRVATLDTSAIAMVPWRLLHISALDGASVQVYWEHGTSESSRGQWYPGKLAPKQDMAAGWFRLTYDGTETEEVEQEDLFLGVRADANDDYELVAFRADGADIKDEIRLDPVAFEAAIRSECVNAIATEVVEVFGSSSADASHQEIIADPEVGEVSAAAPSQVGSEPSDSGHMEQSTLSGELLNELTRQHGHGHVHGHAHGAEHLSKAAQYESASTRALPLHLDDQQAELHSLREQLSRLTNKLEAQASDYQTEVEVLNEKLKQAAAAKAKVDKRFADLKDSQERTAKRVDQLTNENDELKRQLQQAKRELRAADRTKQENDELKEQLRQAKCELRAAQRSEPMAFAAESVEDSGRSCDAANRSWSPSLHGTALASFRGGIDCGSCWACLDKPKFGGPNIKRKRCVNQAAGISPLQVPKTAPEATANSSGRSTHDFFLPCHDGMAQGQVSSTSTDAHVTKAGAVMNHADSDDEEEVAVDMAEAEEVAVDLDNEGPSHEPTSVNPGVGDRVQVEWLQGSSRGTYAGEVDEVAWKISSSAEGAFEFRYHVKYDDGDQRWETVGDVTVRLIILRRAPNSAAACHAPVLGRTRRLAGAS